jgi:hypothetical protein
MEELLDTVGSICNGKVFNEIMISKIFAYRVSRC